MAGRRRSDFCVDFTMSLCPPKLKKVNKLTTSNHTALKLRIHVLRSYLKVTCECDLHILPNRKVSAANDHGKNYIKVRPTLVRHLSRNCLLHPEATIYSNFALPWQCDITEYLSSPGQTTYCSNSPKNNCSSLSCFMQALKHFIRWLLILPCFLAIWLADHRAE